MSLTDVLDQHLAQATAAGTQPLAADITALTPLAGDKTALLYEIGQRMTAADREHYQLAKSDQPRTEEFRQTCDRLRTRYLGLSRLEEDLKAAQ